MEIDLPFESILTIQNCSGLRRCNEKNSISFLTVDAKKNTDYVDKFLNALRPG